MKSFYGRVKKSVEISTQGSKVILCTLCDETNEESQVHLLVCEAPAGTSIISSDKNFPVYEDIYVEDAARVESIGKIIMEKYDLLKIHISTYKM